MKRLIFIILILAAAALYCKPQPNQGDILQKFWDKVLIPAVEKSQIEKIIAMAEFPFFVYEGEEKKHIIDQQFFRSISKVLFNKQYIQKLKSIKISGLPFDGSYYRIKFTPAEATRNFNEIFSINGCFNYMFKPSPDSKSLIFCGIEINLPCDS
mgnify:CR=1 FL=1